MARNAPRGIDLIHPTVAGIGERPGSFLGVTTGQSVHDVASRGFGRNATDYERARPGYPMDAVNFLIDRLDIRPKRAIVDVGAGTGKLTRLLMPSGATIVAVEPVSAMREELLRVLPRAIVHDATADRLPFEDGSIDAITCAQAFHWFATVDVLEEFARVLRPGHVLALVWNVRDNTVPWVRQFTELLQPYEGNRPDHNRGDWHIPFETDVPFSALETTSFSYEQYMTPDLLVARAASMSFVGALDEATRASVLGCVYRLGNEQGSSFTIPYRTDIHLSVRQ